MTAAEIEERARLSLQRMAAFGVVWVFLCMFVVLCMPYAAALLHIELGDFERSLVNNTVSAINNAFFVVLGYLYGKSTGTQAKDDALVAGTRASAAALQSVLPTPQQTQGATGATGATGDAGPTGATGGA